MTAYYTAKYTGVGNLLAGAYEGLAGWADLAQMANPATQPIWLADRLLGRRTYADRARAAMTRLGADPDSTGYKIGRWVPDVVAAVYTGGETIWGRAALGGARSAVGSVAPDAAQEIIQSTARAQAAQGPDALSGLLSAAERAAMAEHPELTSRMLGQAVHRGTAAALEEAFPGRFWYRTRGPDFVDRLTGEMLELTTSNPRTVAEHLARPGYANSTICTYVLQTKC